MFLINGWFVPLMLFFRIGLVIVLGLGFFYLATLTLWDCFVRLKTINYMGIGFLLLGIATFSHLISILDPRDSMAFTLLALLLHAGGLLFVWIHFQLMQHDGIHPISFALMMTMEITAVTLICTWLLRFTTAYIVIELSIFFVWSMSVIALKTPIWLAVQDFLTRKNRHALGEGIAYKLIFLAITGHVIHFFLGSDEYLFLLIANMFILLGAGGLIVLYTKNPQLMHRLPFRVWYLLGFHDSGLLFFKRELHQQFMKVNGTRMKQRLPFLSSMLTAIEALFKHILDQDIIFTIQRSQHLELVFLRDPEKQLGYVIIAEDHSYYLLQALKTLLFLTPLHVFVSSEDKQEQKTKARDDQSPRPSDLQLIVDSKRIEQVLLPLIHRVFPTIKVQSTLIGKNLIS